MVDSLAAHLAEVGISPTLLFPTRFQFRGSLGARSATVRLAVPATVPSRSTNCP
jgi:hypothetical protein